MYGGFLDLFSNVIAPLPSPPPPLPTTDCYQQPPTNKNKGRFVLPNEWKWTRLIYTVLFTIIHAGGWFGERVCYQGERRSKVCVSELGDRIYAFTLNKYRKSFRILIYSKCKFDIGRPTGCWGRCGFWKGCRMYDGVVFGEWNGGVRRLKIAMTSYDLPRRGEAVSSHT